jgi:hypothetical protein
MPGAARSPGLGQQGGLSVRSPVHDVRVTGMAKNLVEPQGVNAGEPDPGAEPGKPVESAESGGDVAAAPDRGQGLIGYPDAKTDEQIAGGPVEPEPHPEQKDGSSGQDAGLME